MFEEIINEIGSEHIKDEDFLKLLNEFLSGEKFNELANDFWNYRNATKFKYR